MTALFPHQVREDDGPILRIELARNPDAPALARAAITGFCENQAFSPTTMARLTLLVSEVVTNAVVHPDVKPLGMLALYASRQQGRVRIEVSDPGQGFTPAPRNPNRLEGGYGLYLLEKEAARWGVEATPGTTVWFEVATQTG